ncbi:MAG TPA: hypothetical protein VHS07_02925 [Candidatus Binataceae bacterium]|nr:hypothetical protein [Candidatus Binataceae bacterium]
MNRRHLIYWSASTFTLRLGDLFGVGLRLLHIIGDTSYDCRGVIAQHPSRQIGTLGEGFGKFFPLTNYAIAVYPYEF